MRIYEISRRDFLKGVGAAGIAAGANVPVSTGGASSLTRSLVQAAANKAANSILTVDLDFSSLGIGQRLFNRLKKTGQWKLSNHDLTNLVSDEYGIMPWGAPYYAGVTPGGVHYLVSDFNKEQTRGISAYIDPETKTIKTYFTMPRDPGYDALRDPDTIRRNAERHIDRAIRHDSLIRSKKDMPQSQSTNDNDLPNDVVGDTVKHSAAEFGLERLAQLAGVKALSGSSDKSTPDQMSPDQVQAMRNRLTDLDTEKEPELALPNRSDDDQGFDFDLDSELEKDAVHSKKHKQ